MDPITSSIFIGIVSGLMSNALYGAIKNTGDYALKFLFEEENIEEIIKNNVDFETLIEEKITGENYSEIIKSEKFLLFLQSSEVLDVVQSVYDYNILPGNTYSTLNEAKQHFSNLFASYFEIDETNPLFYLSAQIFELLIEACNRSLTDIIKDNESFQAHEALSKYRHQTLHDEHVSLHHDHLILHDDNIAIQKDIDEIKEGIKSIQEEKAENEYQYLLDSLRDNLKENNPTEALKRLVNLKEKIWDKASSNVKYALLSIEASANLKLNRHKDAGKLLIEAFQHSKIEKAMVNAAYGYFLLNECSTSKQLIQKVLDINPMNQRALSILIQMFTKEEELDEIPVYMKETQDVAYAIGNFYLKLDNSEEAIKWLKIAISNEKEPILEMKPILASILLDKILSNHKEIHEFQLSENSKENLEHIIHLITVAWDSIIDSNLQKIHVDWIVNRSIANHLLGAIESSKEDINIAYKLTPSNPRVVYFKALVELDDNKIEKAINLLKEIDLYKSIPEVPLLYFDMLRKQRKFEDAISEITIFLEQNKEFQKVDQLYRVLIYTYLESDFKEGTEKATELADSRLRTDNTNIEKIIDLSRCLAKCGQTESALSHLNNAISIICDSTPTIHLMELADEFFRLKLYENSSQIYRLFVDSTHDTILTHKFVEAYYRFGDIGKALEICKNLREKYGSISHITNIEIAIYNEIGDLPSAKRIINEYMEKYPDDMDMKLDLAFLNLRSNSLNDVNDFLKQSHDINLLSVENGIRLALLYNERGFFRKAVETLYEIRRKNFDNERAHLAYINLFILNEQEESDNWLHQEKVDLDTVIVIEERTGKQTQYVIVDSENIDLQRGELKLQSPLAILLCGTVEGEKVSYKTLFSEETLEIKSVKSKYLHAFQESIDKFSYMFPDNQGIAKIPVSSNKDEKISQETLEQMKEIVRLNSEYRSKAVDKYLKHQLTLGSLAKIINQNIFDIWFEFTKYPDLGVHCAFGSDQERDEALNKLTNRFKLIVDPISLITLFSLNIEDIIVNNFGRLGIAQSTIDLLQETLILQNSLYARKHGILFYFEGELIFKDVDSKDVQEKIDLYKQMLSWISTNCDILPCTKALYINREERKKDEKLLGQTFADTILIATENENILYCDDKMLNLVAKQKYNVDGIWTQVLLLHCLNNSLINNEQYSKLTIELISLHYYHTAINSNVLLEAAKKSNWTLESSLTNVLKLLNGKYCNEESALNVVTHFLSIIWTDETPLQNLYVIVFSLLNTLVDERFSPLVINKLKIIVIESVGLFSVEDKEGILELIRLWELIYYKSLF